MVGLAGEFDSEYVSPCSVPDEIIVGSLAAGLTKAGITSAEVVAEDMWELPPEMTTPVVDEMIAGHDFPMVMIDKRVICMDGINVDAVVKELSYLL